MSSTSPRPCISPHLPCSSFPPFLFYPGSMSRLTKIGKRRCSQEDIIFFNGFFFLQFSYSPWLRPKQAFQQHCKVVGLSPNQKHSGKLILTAGPEKASLPPSLRTFHKPVFLQLPNYSSLKEERDYMFTEWLNRSFCDDIKMAQHAHVITYVPAVNLDEGGGGGGGVCRPAWPIKTYVNSLTVLWRKASSSSFCVLQALMTPLNVNITQSWIF